MCAKRNSTKRLTVCAMTAALSVVILYLGAFIEVLDLTMAVMASMLSTVMVIEYGKSAPWSVYGVTSLLSLILLPQKLPALMYTLFFGYYPIIKEFIEKIKSKIAQWAIKLCIFATATALLLLLLSLFTAELERSGGTLLLAAYIALAFVAMILYDIALTRIISFYIARLRHRFRKLF